MTIHPELIELGLLKHFGKQSFELFGGTVATIHQIVHNRFSGEEEVAMGSLLT